MPAIKRGPGRPAKAPEDRKSINVTIRTRPGFRDELERLAVESGRSITEEAETRLTESFAESAIADAGVRKLHILVRRYLQLLAVRKTDGLDISSPAIIEALNIGMAMIIDAACLGPFSEDRVKEIVTIDLGNIRKQLGLDAMQVVNDAFNLLLNAGLVNLDHMKMMEWFASGTS